MNPHLEHLQKLTASLRDNLEKCATGPAIDPVHDVRTGTRRVQAIAEAILRERSEGVAAETALAEATRKWLRQLKRIRRAAAPVRDLDVHRELLKKFLQCSDEEGASQAVPDPGSAVTTAPSPDDIASPAAVPPRTLVLKTPIADQADHLDAWLRHARQHQAAVLQQKAVKALPRFDAEAAAFAAAVSQGRATRRRPRSAAIVALESFACLVNEMQQLDAGNLHDFRKGAKKARYIAESAAEDASALAVGKALKKLQDAIGDWHDWLVLADEARTALGDDENELIALLDSERDRHYVSAMKTVERLRGRLLGEWQARLPPRRRTSSRPTSSGRKTSTAE